jgi:NH3-dependent NAD+ synthetase
MIYDLTINTDVARRILTSFIRSEVTRVGFTRAIINLSGGLDSALSCALAAEALGGENVMALRLPYRTSSPDSLEHAQLMIDKPLTSQRWLILSSNITRKCRTRVKGTLWLGRV